MTKRKDGTFKLYMVWIIVLGVVVLITVAYQRESTNFYGIAETHEMTVNSKVTVEIMVINVLEGQLVEEGDLLVELGSPELTLKINEISHQLDQLKAEKGISKSEIKSNIRELRAQKASIVSDINYQIRTLENKYKINKNLSSGLTSLKRTTKNSGKNPIQLQISALKEELKLSVSPINIKIGLLKRELNESDSPIKIRVQKLEEELKLLGQESGKLNIYSQMSGIIGSVNFKAGEKVAPFTPILTIHARNPSFVKGYIHENVYNRMAVNDKVNVISVADNRNLVEGTIASVGARIIEYPIRLRKHPDIAIWGRELLIKIPEHNKFILGEKVLISSTKVDNMSLFDKVGSLFVSQEIQGAKLPAKPLKPQFKTIDLEKNIEASEVLYLKDIDRYLVLSDDTDNKKPQLFLVDKMGKVEKVLISGLKKINDMESAAITDNGDLFIASSQSFSKKGNLKYDRKLLIKVKRSGKDFSLLKGISLYNVLDEYSKKNAGECAQFLKESIENKRLDIEAMFFKEDGLFLGVKNPRLDDQSIILKISEIDKVMTEEKVKTGVISIWKKVTLKDGSGKKLISGMALSGSDLFITGTTKTGGGLWKLNIDSDVLELVRSFSDLRPEGVSLTPKKDELLLAFDQGVKTSKIGFLKVQK